MHDAGAQLGAGGLRDDGTPAERQKREAESDALGRLEPRIRQLARELASELVAEWTAFKAGRAAPSRP